MNQELRRTGLEEEEKSWLASFPLLNPNPIVEADLDGRVCFANPTARRLFPDIEQSAGRNTRGWPTGRGDRGVPPGWGGTAGA